MEIIKSLIQVRNNSKNCCCYFAQKKQSFLREPQLNKTLLETEKAKTCTKEINEKRRIK